MDMTRPFFFLRHSPGTFRHVVALMGLVLGLTAFACSDPEPESSSGSECLFPIVNRSTVHCPSSR